MRRSTLAHPTWFPTTRPGLHLHRAFTVEQPRRNRLADSLRAVIDHPRCAACSRLDKGT